MITPLDSLKSFMLEFRARHRQRAALRSRALPVLAALLMLGASACVINRPAPPLSGAQRVFDPRYTNWNFIVTHYVTPAGVDYAGLKRDKRDGLLEIALTEMALVTPEQFEGWTPEARLAFLINAHNAHAMHRILIHYPVKSLGGTVSLFSSARGVRNIRLLGREWSLDSLADEITGYPYHQSRAIFLLNWGAKGCAPLPGVAVTAQNINDLLERQTREFIGNPKNFEYNPKRHILYVTKILGWYRDDIERDFGSVWEFLKHYLPKETKDFIGQQKNPPRIRYLKFDKSLNEAPAPAK